MRVGDVMTTNVVTIPSNTPVSEAKRLLALTAFEDCPSWIEANWWA